MISVFCFLNCLLLKTRNSRISLFYPVLFTIRCLHIAVMTEWTGTLNVQNGRILIFLKKKWYSSHAAMIWTHIGVFLSLCILEISKITSNTWDRILLKDCQWVDYLAWCILTAWRMDIVRQRSTNICFGGFADNGPKNMGKQIWIHFETHRMRWRHTEWKVSETVGIQNYIVNDLY